MRIVLTGGGSGGHFYPLIAVVEAIEDVCHTRTLIEPDIYYIGPTPFDMAALMEHDITHLPGAAGRLRRYPSALNFLSVILATGGVLRALSQLFRLYPDVVFSTGGFAAFPTLFAARILHIPVVIYDADSLPGRVSLWSSSFAKWIAIAHPDAVSKFPVRARKKIVHVGHPIRKEIMDPIKEGGHEFLKLDPSIPTIFVSGGSQGARAINEVILDALPALLSEYNIVHQTGTENLEETTRIASVVLKDSKFKDRYRPFGLLNTLALRMTAGIAALAIARAGSGTIFELASWGIPAILIPIPLDVSHDQTENAFSYARSGAALVIEQHNLAPHLLVAEIKRLMTDDPARAKMATAAHTFAEPQAAQKIATALVDIMVEHEPK